MKTKLFIFTLMTIIFSIATSQYVQASTTFYEGEYIPNIWVNKEKDGRIRYQQARFLRRADGQFSYCIEPWSEISNQVDYSDIIDINTLNDDTLEKLSLIAYYGYGYTNHTDIKWYYITQVLIWKEVDKTSSFYFTDKLNGNKITTYDQDMNEILNLVEKHQKRPNFSVNQVELLYGEKGTIIDVNNVLDSYEIVNTQDNVILDKKSNRINIETTKIGESTIQLERKDNIYQSPPIVYRHPINQNFLTVGSYKAITVNLPVKVVGGEIVVKKLDMDTKLDEPSGEASLIGSRFVLYNSNMEKVYDFTLKQYPRVKLGLLKADTYTLKEIMPGKGYLLNTTQIEIVVDGFHKKQTISFENKIIENQIKITKFYGKEEGPWYLEEGITFEFYNTKGEKVEEQTTDERGEINITLPYGTYTVKQINSKENYEKVEDFTITVETPEAVQTFEKYNKEITGKLLLIKLDEKTNETIRLNKASFLLTNKDTEEEIGIYETNEEGILKIDNLSLGNYTLKEIKAPNGYLLSEEEINFTISLEKRDIVLEIYNQQEEKKEEIKHTISVPNTSSIQIDLGKELCDDKKKYYTYFTRYNVINI